MNRNQIDPSLKIIALPLIIIVASLLGIGLIANYALPAIQSKQAVIKEAKLTQVALEQRISILKEFQAGILDDKSDVIYTVFPDKNPGAVVLTQMRSIGTEDQVEIQRIEFSPPETDQNMNKTKMEYDLVSNDFNSIIRFLGKLQKSAPISTIDEVSMGIIEDKVKTTLKSSIYWADLPTGLPELTEPIKDLSTEEKVLLNEVFSYRLPEFSTLLPESQAVERVNPFN